MYTTLTFGGTGNQKWLQKKKQFYTLQMYFLNQLKSEPTRIQFSANLKTVLLFQFGYFSFLLFCMRSSHSSDVGEDRLVQRMLAEWKEQENIRFILTWKYLRIIPRWLLPLQC